MTGEPSRDGRFRAIFDEHHADVWRYCVRRVPRDEAQDLLSDVFVVVWRRLDDVPPGAEARPWIFGVARNLVVNRHRSERRRSRLLARLMSVHSGPVGPAEVDAERRDEQRAVMRAFAGLPEADRELVILRTWEELSLADIATVVGLSTRAVEARLRRIRHKLARVMADGNGEADVVPMPVLGAPTRRTPESSPGARREGGARS